MDDDGMLRGVFAVDVWSMLHSRLTPEQYADQVVKPIKEELLEKFYQRFPGQRPSGR